MRTATWCIVAAALAAAAGPAGAATSLAVAPVKGQEGAAVKAQLDAALCASRPCVQDAFPGGKVDLERARSRGAQAALVGSLWTEKGGRVLSLALFTTGTKPVRAWKLALGKGGKLPAATLAGLAADVDAALGGPAPRAAVPPAAAPRAAPAPAAAATAAAVQPAQPPQAAPVAAQAGAPSRPQTAAAPEVAPAKAQGRTAARPPWLTLEAGICPGHLELGYPASAGAAVPVGLAVDAPATPRLRVEASLPSRRGTPPLEPAIYVDFAYQPGVPLERDGRTHDAVASHLEAGALVRWRATDRLLVLPALAYEQEKVTVGASGGVSIAGLPDVDLAGVRASVGLEAAIGTSRFTALAGGGLTWWLSAGELAGGEGFFPGGSALGLSAEGGVAVEVWGPLSVRALGTWSRTTWSLDPDPTGTYSNDSATLDAYGGRLSLRARF